VSSAVRRETTFTPSDIETRPAAWPSPACTRPLDHLITACSYPEIQNNIILTASLGLPDLDRNPPEALAAARRPTTGRLQTPQDLVAWKYARGAS